MTCRYALRDDQWERIKDLVPGRNFYCNTRIQAARSRITLKFTGKTAVVQRNETEAGFSGATPC
ncbi:hypothetical protein [Nostoc sp. WHI]|uniref:hypothetical protein n=1 Tax=Nostoc sp. WHI TaxID=2650611 RepID=UPI0018C730A3|nr:hypothetical protein [Nostoc sp. WHI]MBG1265115.1 hypothetical protein [Nostoc sp. WHI]